MKEGPVLVGLKKSVQTHARGGWFIIPDIANVPSNFQNMSAGGVAFLTFFGHNLLRVRGWERRPLTRAVLLRRRATRHASSETVAQPTRRWRNVRADRRWGARSESRSGQTGAQAVCGRLRDMSSQRTRSCQGPLQTYAVLFPAKALRDQFELGLGADLLSGVRRQSTARPIASRRGEAAVRGDAHITVLDPSARVGAGTVGRSGA
jgi:hypothetical protein